MSIITAIIVASFMGQTVKSCLITIVQTTIKNGIAYGYPVANIDVTLNAVDDGVQTCNGRHNDNGDDGYKGGIPCIAGYSLSFTWPGGTQPVKVNYHTPHGDFQYYVWNDNCSG